MLKSVDKVTTRGLIRNDETGVKLLDEVYERWYDNTLEQKLVDKIEENSYDGDYKNVDEILQKFIGVYPVEITARPIWASTFIQMYTTWIYYCYRYNRDCPENVKFPVAGQYRDCMDKLYKVKEESMKEIGEGWNKSIVIETYRGDISTKMYNDDVFDFISGYATEGKRTMKILKYLTQKTREHIEITQEQIEQLEWYRYYVKHKESNQKLYLVITNSLASLCGMSSYAPKKDDNNRLWQSCQTHETNNEGYAKKSWANLRDEGSLIMYVTDGTNVNFMGFSNDRYMHHAMFTRWMVRLLKRNDSYALAIDRAYASDQYSEAIFHKVYELCKEHGVDMAVHSSYNSGQCEEVFDVERYKHGDYMYYKSAHDIPIVYNYQRESCEHDCSTCPRMVNRLCRACTPVDDDACDACEQNETRHCENCGNFSERRCANRDCDECEYNPCNADEDDCDDDYGKYTHYDDQGGSYEENDSNYKISYCVYIVDDKIMMKPKIKVGDRVMLIKRYNSYLPEGATGTVVSIARSGSERIGVKFDDFKHGHNIEGTLPVGARNGYSIRENYLDFTDIPEPVVTAIEEVAATSEPVDEIKIGCVVEMVGERIDVVEPGRQGVVMKISDSGDVIGVDWGSGFNGHNLGGRLRESTGWNVRRHRLRLVSLPNVVNR